MRTVFQPFNDPRSSLLFLPVREGSTGEGTGGYDCVTTAVMVMASPLAWW